MPLPAPRARAARRSPDVRRGLDPRRRPVARWALLACLLLSALVPSLDPSLTPPAAAAPIVKMPFAAGQTWTVTQGYDTSPASGGSHYNCNPSTLKDEPSGTRSCSRYWQYRYSFDITKSGGSTAGQTVYSPVDGTIRWIDQAYGGMSIDIGGRHAYAFFHVDLLTGLAAGQRITQGQVLGTVAPPGQRGNGGFDHIHVTLWQTTDGGNWSRVAVPFTGSYAMDGYDFPATAGATNQHRSRTLTSTNAGGAGGGGGGATPPTRPTNLSPASGTTNTASTVTLRWEASAGAAEYEVWVDGAARSGWVTGTSSTTSALAAGRHTWQVRARNAAGVSSLSSTWNFTVGVGAGGGYLDNGSKIGTGRYRVIGTREGGFVDGPLGPGGTPGTTSSGHRILENDHFISLPACLPTNCPGLTGGQVSTSTGYQYNGYYVSDCGTNCWVKVVNPTTNRCDVVQVLDKGPWFRIDNWWDTESLRNINTNPNNPNKLAQGYSAAAAARNKLNVGFGVDANGYGRTNVRSSSGTYSTTGQPNSVDIADGTWLEIGFPWNPGPQSVILEMLWQTGQSKASAEAACGGGSNETKPTVTLNRSSGPATTSVTVSGAGFQGGETVNIYLDSSRTTPLATTTANSAGVVSRAVVIPATYGGDHRLHVVGQSSKRRNAATFRVTPTATVSPGSGSAGLEVTVTVAGFGRNETVGIVWPGRVTPSAQVTTDATGNGRFTVRAPRRHGPQLGRLTGATSGLSSTVTFTVVQRVRVSPGSAGGGDTVLVYGLGWPSGTRVDFRWGTTSGSVLCSATTDSYGYAECDARVPAGSASYDTYIVGVGAGLSARAPFTKTGMGAGAVDDPTETPVSAASPVAGSPVASETPAESPVASETATVEVAPSETATPEPAPTETAPPVETPAPTETPVSTNTPAPTETPVPTPREVVLVASADTSVTYASPEAPQAPEAAGTLVVGGPDTAVAYVTFDVAGVAPGTVVDATLVLTGAVDGAGGPVGAVAGFAVDEVGMTYLTAPTQDVPAAGTAAGEASRVGPVASGATVAVDVTATVRADGTVTFVLMGDEVGYAVSSREGGAPPTLVIHVLDPG